MHSLALPRRPMTTITPLVGSGPHIEVAPPAPVSCPGTSEGCHHDAGDTSQLSWSGQQRPLPPRDLRYGETNSSLLANANIAEALKPSQSRPGHVHPGS